MKPSRFLKSCPVIFLAHSLLTTAQQVTPAAEEVIVTANRIPVPYRKVAGSISVIDEDGLESHGNLPLFDILRQMPSTGASNSGGAGQPTAVRVRGEEGFRTLTLVDGIRISDPSGPQIAPQLEHLMSSGIGRIEMLRGPQGLGYGADAGGVLNISSRRVSTGLAGNIVAQTGRYATRQLSAELGGGNGQADFFVTLADLDTEGFNTRDIDTVLRDDDGYANTTFHGRAGFNVTSKLRAEVVYRNVAGESMYDGCGDSADCTSLHDQEAARVSLQYTGETASHSLGFATTATDRDFLTNGISAFAPQGKLQRLEYVGSTRGLSIFDLVYGFDLDTADSDGIARDNRGVFAEVLSDFSETLFLTAGVRYDDNDDFGAHTTYRVSAAYLYETDNDNILKFKTSYGTGFRAPAPAEVAYNAGPFAFAPATLARLVQETSRGIEWGVEYLAGSVWHLEAVYFSQEVADAIDFDLTTFSGYTQLAGTSHSRGVELNGQLEIGSFAVRANYTFNETRQPDGLPRRRRPEHLANLGVTWRGFDERLHLNAWYRVSRDAYDGFNVPLGKLDDFAVLDLSGSYDLSASVQLFARIENALDEVYEEIATYNTAGAAAYLGFRAGFAAP